MPVFEKRFRCNLETAVV